MSFWANVFLGKCCLGKCPSGKTSYGQMSLGKRRMGKHHGIPFIKQATFWPIISVAYLKPKRENQQF
jgi:hypothetical protein